jgi:hypothetical protein
LALAELAHIEVRQGAAHPAAKRAAAMPRQGQPAAAATRAALLLKRRVARLVHLPPGYRSLGRPVRKPAARHEAPGSDRADHRADDLFAAVLGLPLMRQAMLVLSMVPFT